MVGVNGLQRSQFLDGLVVAPGMKQDEAVADTAVPQRIKFAGSLDRYQGLIGPTLAQEPNCESFMCTRSVWIQFQGTLVFCLGIAPLPLSLIHLPEQNVRLGELRIQLECFPSCTHQFCT